MEEKFIFGSETLKEELEGSYAKFALGIPVNIEVFDEEIVKRIVEFEDKGEKRLVTKYDINIKIKEQEKIWSVSKKVLNTINEHIENTKKFKVILRDTQYEVIPLGLKE